MFDPFIDIENSIRDVDLCAETVQLFLIARTLTILIWMMSNRVNLVVKPSAGDEALRAPSLPPALTVIPSASTMIPPASTAPTASTLVQPMIQAPSAAVEDSSMMDEDDDL